MIEKIIQNDRVSSPHFISEKPAALYDVTNPDWLSTLLLSHSKVKRVDSDRWDRMRSRRSTRATLLLKSGDPEPSPEPGHAKTSVEVETDMTAASVSLLR